MTIRNKVTAEWGTFPCGKCPPCLKARASSWSYRLMKEEKLYTNSMFLTLTYDTSTVPITPRGYMTLRKSDLQLFFKRLRKALPDSKIKYYAVGEYGGKTCRPHYHIILFGANPGAVAKAWCIEDKFTRQRTSIGNCHYGVVTGASVGYTLKYIQKPGKIPMHRNDDRVKEFSLMSKDWAAHILPMLR